MENDSVCNLVVSLEGTKPNSFLSLEVAQVEVSISFLRLLFSWSEC